MALAAGIPKIRTLVRSPRLEPLKKSAACQLQAEEGLLGWSSRVLPMLWHEQGFSNVSKAESLCWHPAALTNSCQLGWVHILGRLRFPSQRAHLGNLQSRAVTCCNRVVSKAAVTAIHSEAQSASSQASRATSGHVSFPLVEVVAQCHPRLPCGVLFCVVHCSGSSLDRVEYLAGSICQLPVPCEEEHFPNPFEDSLRRGRLGESLAMRLALQDAARCKQAQVV